jgi:hypothetical protein
MSTQRRAATKEPHAVVILSERESDGGARTQAIADGREAAAD